MGRLGCASTESGVGRTWTGTVNGLVQISTLDLSGPLPITDYAPRYLTCGNSHVFGGAGLPARRPGLP